MFFICRYLESLLLLPARGPFSTWAGVVKLKNKKHSVIFFWVKIFPFSFLLTTDLINFCQKLFFFAGWKSYLSIVLASELHWAICGPDNEIGTRMRELQHGNGALVKNKIKICAKISWRRMKKPLRKTNKAISFCQKTHQGLRGSFFLAKMEEDVGNENELTPKKLFVFLRFQPTVKTLMIFVARR